MPADSQLRSVALDPRGAPGTFDAHRLDEAGARAASAVGSTLTALKAVAASRDVLWTFAAGDGYRSRVDDALGRLRSLRDALTDIVDDLRLLARRTWTCTPGSAPMAYVSGNWSQASRSPRFAIAPTGGGLASRVGADAGVVDPETLVKAAILLDDAAQALGDAQGRLVTYSGSSSYRAIDEVDRICHRMGALAASPVGPRHRADDVRELAGAARGAAQRYLDGETRAQGVVHDLAALAGWLVVENPVLNLAVLSKAVPVAVGAGLGVLAASTIDPEGTANVLGRLGGLVVSTDAVDPIVAGLAAAMRAGLPGMQLPTVRPVQEVSEEFARGLAALTGPVVVVPLVDPPQMAAAVGFGGALDLVARSYGTAQDGASPSGTVTIQQIVHPDGTRSWVVAIPGTEALVGGEVPLDGVSDVQFAAGVAEAVTPSVIRAMEEAQIPPDEPVVLVGHSLGGMIATSVAWAAAGRFRIGGLVTAGSPSIPKGLPPGVPTIRFEHDEDAVPHADDVPTQVTEDANVVQRSLGDVRPAHDIDEYRLTGALQDAKLQASPLPRSGMAAVTSLLGGDGATATTTQYQLVRELGDGRCHGGGGW